MAESQVSVENMRYLKTHGLHMIVDKMVHRLIQKQPKDFRVEMLQYLREETERGRPMESTATEIKPQQQPQQQQQPQLSTADRKVTRGRSITMLKAQKSMKYEGGTHEILKPAQSVLLGEGLTPIGDGRRASRSRKGSSLSVLDREIPQSTKTPEKIKQENFADIAGEVLEGDDEQNYGCHCTIKELLEGIPEEVLNPTDPSTIQFQKLFYKCVTCNRRPAQFLSLHDTSIAMCKPHAEELFRKDSKHGLWVNYDISIYERSFMCMRCGMFTSEYTDPLDNILMALCDTKGTFLEEPVRDIFIEILCEEAAVTGCMQGWRSTQEDAHYAAKLKGTHVFAVLDGHGGTFTAQWVATNMETILLQRLPANGTIDDKVLEDIFVQIDETLGLKFTVECSSVGTTCCMVLITESEIICANIGDSRAVLYSDDQGVVPLSEDHTLDDPEEVKRVLAAGYSVVRNRIEGLLSVPRAFGDYDFKQCGGKSPAQQAVSVQPTVTRRARSASDSFIIIACDGVWDGYDNEDACSHVVTHLKGPQATPTSAITSLLETNLCPEIDEEAIGTDNQTCTLVDLKKIQ